MMGLVCALIAASAGADTLADVRAAVGRLTAKAPVRATYATQENGKAAGRFANDVSARSLSLEVTHDANGVTIVIPQTLLDKANQASRDRSANNTAQSAIDSARIGSIIATLDYRDHLLAMLDGATLIEEKRAFFRGSTVRLLVVKVNPPKRKKNTVEIGESKSDRRLSLWIGDDNLPIAGEENEKTTAGFMMFKGTHEGRTSYNFTHSGDRLVLTREEGISSGSGMGQTFEEKFVQTVTLH
jgi:hypothetical protein